MSLESGRDRITEILEARYDFETCEEARKASARTRYERLLDEACAGTPYSGLQLVEALAPRMRDFRAARRRDENRRQH